MMGLVKGLSTGKKSKKKIVEGKSRNVGNPQDRLRGSGYMLVNPEARETLRSQIVHNFFGAGFKDFGIVTHEGVRNIDWHKDRNRKSHTTIAGAQANAPNKGDMGWGADQMNVDLWQKHQKEVQNQVINPQARSHHALDYSGEGLINRKGTASDRKIETAVNDGENREYGFTNRPRFSKTGRDNTRRRNLSARRASRTASKIMPAI
jgi:hypothetical protein